MRSPSIGVDSARGIEKEAPHTHRLVVARQYADQGGLAGAVRAQQADDLTRGDVEGDIAQRGKVPVVLADSKVRPLTQRLVPFHWACQSLRL